MQIWNMATHFSACLYICMLKPWRYMPFWKQARHSSTAQSNIHSSHMHESGLSFEWFMSILWRRLVSHMNDSCLTYEWVMSLVWMSHGSHMDESCLTYGWVVSRIWTSHVFHMNKSCLLYEWVMSLTWHMQGLKALKKLKVLSIGRNCLKKLDGIGA